MKEVELKKCPFCGGEAEYDSYDIMGDDDELCGYGWFISCVNKHCKISPSVGGTTDDPVDVYDEWNTRAERT